MINVMNAIKANGMIKDWNGNAEITLQKLRKERGRMHVKIEETRLHDAKAHETYREHLKNIEAAITNIENAMAFVSQNKKNIIVGAAKI